MKPGFGLFYNCINTDFMLMTIQNCSCASQKNFSLEPIFND